MFVPDRRRPTWRDISLPSRMHGVMYTAGDNSGSAAAPGSAAPAGGGGASSTARSTSIPLINIERMDSNGGVRVSPSSAAHAGLVPAAALMQHQVVDFPPLSPSQQRRSLSPAGLAQDKVTAASTTPRRNNNDVASPTGGSPQPRVGGRSITPRTAKPPSLTDILKLKKK